MYGIFIYMYHKNQLNVGKYIIHGWYGNAKNILGLKKSLKNHGHHQAEQAEEGGIPLSQVGWLKQLPIRSLE